MVFLEVGLSISMPLGFGVGQSRRVAREISGIVSQAQDLANAFDQITQKFEHGNIADALGGDRAMGQLREFRNLLMGITEEEAKLSKVKRELLKLEREASKRIQDLKDERKILKNKDELTERDKIRLKKINVELKDKRKHLERIQELESPENIAKLERQYAALFSGMKRGAMTQAALHASTKAYMGLLNQLIAATEKVYKWQDKLQGAMSQLARRLGSTTMNLDAMHASVKASLLAPGGLGDLGFSLDEVTGMFGDFQEALEFTNRVSTETYGQLARLAIGLGQSAQWAGELTRDFLLMGRSAEDAAVFMGDMMQAGRRAGVTAAAMSKQLNGAGRSLFLLTGPRAQESLKKTMVFLGRMGTGLDKIKGFVDLTDVFDQTTEAMARVNTAFGTHINALEVMSESDPGKRLANVIEQLRMQGMGLDMTRQQKKLLMESLHIDEQTMNSVLTAAQGNKSITAELERQAKFEEERAKTNAAFEEGIMRAKSTLVAIEQIAGRVWDTMSRILEPMFRGFGEGGKIGQGVGMLDRMVKRLSDAFSVLMFKLEKAGLAEKLAAIGSAFGKLFDLFIQIIESDDFASFASGLLTVFQSVTSVMGYILGAVAKFIVITLGLIGKLFDAIRAVGKYIDQSWLGKLLGTSIGVEESKSAASAAARAGGVSSLAVVAPQQASAGPTGAMAAGVQGYAPVGISAQGAPAPAASPVDIGTTGASKNQSTMPFPVQPAPNQSSLQPVNVQVNITLDGEKIQDAMYRSSIRRQQ